MWSPLVTLEQTFLSSIEDLISDQGDVAIVIDTHPDTPGQYFISAYMDFNSPSASTQDISYSYLTACDTSLTSTDFTSFTYMSLDSDLSPSLHTSLTMPNISFLTWTDLCTYSLATNNTPTPPVHWSLLVPVDFANPELVLPQLWLTAEASNQI
jgi:hypothetical protein